MAKKNNEAKIKFTAETGDFNDSIKKSNDELSKLRAEMRLNAEQMKTTGETAEGLEKKHQNLSNQLAVAQEKTVALSQKLDKAREIFGSNSEEAKKLETQLINAQIAEEKIKQSIQDCEKALSNHTAETQDNRNALEKLTDEIGEQKTELSRMKQEYQNAVLEYGEASDEARSLESAISNLSDELKQNEDKLSSAANKANELDKSFEEAGEGAKSAGDGFTVMKGVIADLASNAIQGAIGKISEFTGYLADLPAQTAELRQDFATLETSFDNVGFSTETATQTWKELYTVFGEDDRAVEASNLIAKMSKDQNDLNDWVTITTGVWGTYQDSLPVEGLAEASMETARTGKVTGGLADALNWSSEAQKMFSKYIEEGETAEDGFNKALAECTTEQERQQLITSTLKSLYGDAAETYRDTSAAQMEAKAATAENILAENELAASIEPVTTAVTEVKTALLTGLAPAIQTISGAVLKVIGWAKEHPAIIKAIAAAVGVLVIGLGGLATAWGVYTVAQTLANTAMLVPAAICAGIVVAIAAVVAIIVILAENWDAIKQKTLEVWNAIKSAIAAAWEAIKNAVSTGIEFVKNLLSTVMTAISTAFQAAWNGIKTFFETIWNGITSFFTTVTNGLQNAASATWEAIKNTTETVFNAVKEFFTTVWNGIKNTFTTVTSAIKNTVSNAFNAVRNTVSSIWNGISSTTSSIWNGIRSSVSNVANGIRSTVTSVFNGVKSTTTTVWNAIKNAIVKPVEAAKNTVKNLIDKIKGIFNFEWKLPELKLPHVSVKGGKAPYGIAGKGSLPKFSVEWYREGGIMTKPTLFGMNGNNLMGGGEAGPEAILPIEKLEGYIANAVEKTVSIVNFQSLADAIIELANRPTELNINGKRFATATAGDSDRANGLRSSFIDRGLVLD